VAHRQLPCGLRFAPASCEEPALPAGFFVCGPA